jgi:hypothetical protein
LLTNPKPWFTNLRRDRIAVVYNTNAAMVTDSEASADYYIAARGLNSSLKFGLDFGTATAVAGGDEDGGTFYTNVLVPIDTFFRANNVQGVIVSSGCPDRVLFTVQSGGFCGLLATSAQHVRAGEVRITTLMLTNLPDDPSPNLPTALFSDVASRALAQLRLYTLFYDNSTIQFYPFRGTADGAYKLSDLDYRKAVQPYGDSNPPYYRAMPCGRLGHPPRELWADTFANTQRCIDDAMAAELGGWAVNRHRQHNGLHSVRNEFLNVHQSGIWAHTARQAGWNVKGLLNNGGLGAGLSDEFTPDLGPASTAQEVFDYFGVVYNDMDPAEVIAGTVDPPEPSFATFGCFLNNSTISDNSWQDSFAFDKGAYHLISTSSPSATLSTALASGACAGIGGSIEPFAKNTGMISPVMIGLGAGLTLMEAHYHFYEENVTTWSFPAGDPLYAPYKRSTSVNRLTDTIALHADNPFATTVGWFIAFPGTGTVVPSSIAYSESDGLGQRINVITTDTAANELAFDIQNNIAGTFVVPEDYFDYIEVILESTGAVVDTFERIAPDGTPNADVTYTLGVVTSRWVWSSITPPFTDDTDYVVNLYKYRPSLSSEYTNRVDDLNVEITGSPIDFTANIVGASTVVMSNLPTGIDASDPSAVTGVPTSSAGGEYRLVKVLATNDDGESSALYFTWTTGAGGTLIGGAGGDDGNFLSPVR